MTNSEILQQLTDAGDKFCKRFIDNLAQIFVNTKIDIANVLLKTEHDILCLLRIKLFVLLIEKLPAYENYDLVSRRKKALLCDDIIVIGNSLITNDENGLMKILKPVDQPPSDEMGKGLNQKYCIEHCKFSRNWTNKQMIRCCFCQVWFHHDCIPDSKEDIEASTIWNCLGCRSIPEFIRNELVSLRQMNCKLVEMVTKLQHENSHLGESNQNVNNYELNQKIENLMQLNDKLTKSNLSLSGELVQLSAEFREFRSKMTSSTNMVPACDPPEAQHTNMEISQRKLLIGSSIIRDINPDSVPNTEVKCMRGARTENLRQFLVSNNKKYESITLVSGSNDCASENTAGEVVDNLNNLIQTAKTFSEGPVMLSSICPRTDNCDYQSKVETVNASMSSSNSGDYTFINNDPTFRLQDNSVNDGYLLPDGLHLSAKGTERLARNLNLAPTYANIVARGNNSGRKNVNVNAKQRRYGSKGTRTTQNQGHRRQESYSQPQGAGEQYCWFCGEESHTTDKCFHGKRITCRSCGRQGHKDKVCWY